MAGQGQQQFHLNAGVGTFTNVGGWGKFGICWVTPLEKMIWSTLKSIRFGALKIQERFGIIAGCATVYRFALQMCLGC